jgi:hypothetical protein
MKSVTYADKTVLSGDEVADVLIDYAATLADHGRADSVSIAAWTEEGEPIEASFVLGTGTNVMAETMSSELPDPDNAAVVAAMTQRLEQLRRGHLDNVADFPTFSSRDLSD